MTFNKSSGKTVLLVIPDDPHDPVFPSLQSITTRNEVNHDGTPYPIGKEGNKKVLRKQNTRVSSLKITHRLGNH